jgi:branched-chain amino acid transport system substrate-binding protein
MRYSFYIILILIALFYGSCKKDGTVSNTNITIGGLLSLTGNWSSLGINSQEAMNLAIKDINNYMVQTGSLYRFSTSIYDTKLDTTFAQVAIRDALSKNIRYLVGPQSSAELGAIRSFANDNEIIVVSQGSTASSLAIAGDALFRFCPGDAVEGKAMAQTIYSSGIRDLITIARDDLGNKGLQQSVGSSFTGLGGTVEPIAPYSAILTDFSPVLSLLKGKISQLGGIAGVDKVGVYIASFDECVTLFQQASLDPVFASVRWFGGDGVVFSTALTSNLTAVSFAMATRFFVPNFGLPQQANPNLAIIAAAIKSKTGIDADAYALSVYDAMWVIARTEAAFPTPNIEFSKLKDIFRFEANQYYGITGPIVLNTAGDRSAGSFDYWGIIYEGGTYKWKLVGKSL